MEAEWSEHLDAFSSLPTVREGLFPKPQRETLPIILWDLFQVPFLLLIIGVLSALVSFSVNKIVLWGNTYRWGLVQSIDDHEAWSLYCLFCTSVSLLALFITRLLCREAAGSGLPEMKTILSGTIKPVLLSFRLVVAKISGVTLALIAGLSIGREGPFVQVSGAIADLIMRLPAFQNIRRQDSKRLEIIACACASGVAATFGTSYGSVLFSIELTASAYLVKTLPKAFLTSICAMLMFFILNVSDQLALFTEEIQSKKISPRWNELLAFVWIGVLCGLLGVLFVYLVEFLSTIRNRWLDNSKFTPFVVALRSYGIVGIASFVSAIGFYYELATVPAASGGSHSLFDLLFQRNDMSLMLGKLTVYFIYKFFATAFCVTLPLPVGLFTPIFLTGGVLGRVIGEKLVVNSHFDNFFAWEYSLLAAAGLATGVTRAMSTAVIVYELAGQPHLRLPLSIVVMTAYFVGNRFSKMVYEVLIDTNGTPFMPEIPKKFANLPIAQVMSPVHRSHVLALDSTYREGIELLKAIDDAVKEDITISHAPKFTSFLMQQSLQSASMLISPTPSGEGSGHRGGVPRSLSIEQPYLDAMQPAKMMYYTPNVIPVVQSKQSMVIVGAVLRSDLKHAVMELQHAIMIASIEPVQLGRVNEDEDYDENYYSDGHEKKDSILSPTEQSIAESSRSQQQQYYQRGVTSPILPSRIVNNEPFVTPNRTPQIATGPGTICLDSGSNNSYLMSSGNLRANVYRDSLDDDRLQHHPLMQQLMQFAIIGDGGRTIIPVATRRKQASKTSPVTSSKLAMVAMALPLDPSPYQIVDSMQLSKVDLLFRMLSLNQAYVTHSGQLVGLVTRSSLREFLGRYTKRPLDRCTPLAMAVWHYLCGNNNNENNGVLSATKRRGEIGKVGYQSLDCHDHDHDDDGHVSNHLL